MMKQVLTAVILTQVFVCGCSKGESSEVHRSNLVPKTIGLGFMSTKKPDDSGESGSGKEQFYVYQFDMPKDKVVDLIATDPAMSGWKKTEHNRFTIFSNPSGVKTTLTIGAFLNTTSNIVDPSKASLTINEFK